MRAAKKLIDAIRDGAANARLKLGSITRDTVKRERADADAAPGLAHRRDRPRRLRREDFRFATIADDERSARPDRAAGRPVACRLPMAS